MTGVDGVGMTYTNLDQVQQHVQVTLTDTRLHVPSEGFRYNPVSCRPEIPSLWQKATG